MSMRMNRGRLAAVLFAVGATGACANGVPLGPSNAATASSAGTATTSSTPAATVAAPTQTTPTTPAVSVAVAYTPDLQPIFNSDCVPCHGTRSPAARYSTATYSGVMAAVTPRSASSALVIVTQPGGAMYSFLSGDRTSKAALIRTWVLNGAPQSR
jgi:hypothetical protein